MRHYVAMPFPALLSPLVREHQGGKKPSDCTRVISLVTHAEHENFPYSLGPGLDLQAGGTVPNLQVRKAHIMPVLNIDDETKLHHELQGAHDRLVVLDFTAKWCGPCRKLSPLIDEMAKTHPHVLFMKIDVDTCSEVASNYEVSALPTVIFVKKNEEIDRVTGSDKAVIESKVNMYGNPAPPISVARTRASRKSLAVAPSISNDTGPPRSRKQSRVLTPSEVTNESTSPIRAISGNNNVSSGVTKKNLSDGKDSSQSRTEVVEKPLRRAQSQRSTSPDGVVVTATSKQDTLQSMESTTFSYDESTTNSESNASETKTHPSEKPSVTVTAAAASSALVKNPRSRRVSRTHVPPVGTNIVRDKMAPKVATGRVPIERKVAPQSSKILKRPRSGRPPVKTPSVRRTVKAASQTGIASSKTLTENDVVLASNSAVGSPNKKSLEIRLADGSKITTEVNMNLPVQSLREVIAEHRPDMVDRHYTFMKLFPSRDIKNENATIRDVKLINSIIVQKISE